METFDTIVATIIPIIQIAIIAFLLFGVFAVTSFFVPHGRIKALIFFPITLVAMFFVGSFIKYAIPATRLCEGFCEPDTPSEFCINVNEFLIEVNGLYPEHSIKESWFYSLAAAIILVLVWIFLGKIIAGVGDDMDEFDDIEAKRVKEANANKDKKIRLDTEIEYDSWRDKYIAKSKFYDDTDYETAVPIALLLALVLLVAFVFVPTFSIVTVAIAFIARIICN